MAGGGVGGAVAGRGLRPGAPAVVLVRVHGSDGGAGRAGAGREPAQRGSVGGLGLNGRAEGWGGGCRGKGGVGGSVVLWATGPLDDGWDCGAEVDAVVWREGGA
jgi:hypothetical protein